MALQIRRGLDSEREQVVFSPGELVFTTDTEKLFIGDGETLGGVFIGGIASKGFRSVYQGTDGEGNPVFQNENEYVGDGHIVLEGLWDVSGIKNLGVSGRVSSSLVPLGTAQTLGTNTDPWTNSYFTSINATNIFGTTIYGNVTGEVTGSVNGSVTGQLTGDVFDPDGLKIVDHKARSFVGEFQGDLYGSVFGNNSSLLLDGINNKLIGSVEGDVQGSIFSDGSTKLVDAVEGKIVGPVETNTVSISDVLVMTALTSAPPGAVAGTIAVADGVSWDPASLAGSTPYPAFFNGTTWSSMI